MQRITKERWFSWRRGGTRGGYRANTRQGWAVTVVFLVLSFGILLAAHGGPTALIGIGILLVIHLAVIALTSGDRPGSDM
jgi:hypothetical protein